MMINIMDKVNCSGCHACYNICPKKCIIMQADEEGFLYPRVDEKDCIDCGLCEKVCPILNKKNEHLIQQAYACINTNEKIRLSSSSGGIFTVIADYVIEQQGIVFGAAFDENFNVVHRYIDTKEEIALLRGSKYVESRIGNTYEEAKNFLDEGKLVLFTGTPCQISGLKNFLKRDYDKLLCIDIICHGVPSPIVWRKYINFKEKTNGKIENISFRNKGESWKLYSVLFQFKNNTKYKEKFTKNIYMKGFLQDLYLRPSCYNCNFKTKGRVSDFTLADFWGINKIYPDMDDDKGVSLVITHSEKADRIFYKLKREIIWEKVDIDKAIMFNPSMIKSVECNLKRNLFFESLINKKISVDKLIYKYTKIGLMEKVYRKGCSVLRKIFFT